VIEPPDDHYTLYGTLWDSIGTLTDTTGDMSDQMVSLTPE